MSKRELRGLSPEIVRFAYSDVLASISASDVEQLKVEIDKQRAMSGARKLKKAVTGEFLRFSGQINDYLSKKYSDNFLITLIIALTLPKVVAAAGGYFRDLKSEYTTGEISQILGLDPTDASQKIYAFRSKVRDNILFEDEDGNAFRLRIGSAEKGKKKFSLESYSRASIGKERVSRIIISHIDGDGGARGFLQHENSYRIQALIDNWSPEISVIKGNNPNETDVFAISDGGVSHSRYYSEGEHVVLIFEIEPLSLGNES